jgi:hypothetical protein
MCERFWTQPVAASILEGLDEMLTVVRLKLPMPLRRSLACQCDREHDGDGASGQSQREALAERRLRLTGQFL